MTAAPAAGKRAAPCRPDWRRAAQLLAYGESIAATAQQIGCSQSQLSRKRRRDPVFQAWIEDFRRMGPEERLAWLRESVHRKIEEEVSKGTVRVLLWLADRMNLVSPASERTPAQELKDLVNGLSPEELREFESLRDPPEDSGPEGDATEM